MKSPAKLITALLAALALIITAAMLTSCSTTPIAVSYTGHAVGHELTVGYSTGKGVGVVINQK